LAQTKRPLKGFKMHYRTSVIQNFWTSDGHLEIASLFDDCMEPDYIGKSDTNNLPAPANLTENPYGGKTFFVKMHLKNRLCWYQAELL
jgi:hypothetical protein